MTLTILGQDGVMVRFGIYDENGIQVRQTHRDCSAEIAEAKRRKKSLKVILEEREL